MGEGKDGIVPGIFPYAGGWTTLIQASWFPGSNVTGHEVVFLSDRDGKGKLNVQRQMVKTVQLKNPLLIFFYFG